MSLYIQLHLKRLKTNQVYLDVYKFITGTTVGTTTLFKT